MLARSPIKKMMKEYSGDKNVTPEAVDRMIELTKQYIQDVTVRANRYVETANRKTISPKELNAALEDIEANKETPETPEEPTAAEEEEEETEEPVAPEPKANKKK